MLNCGRHTDEFSDIEALCGKSPMVSGFLDHLLEAEDCSELI